VRDRAIRLRVLKMRTTGAGRNVVRARPVCGRPRFFFACLLFLVAPIATHADEAQLEIVEPYLELHTGPGRGFPVFHVVDRGARVTLVTRKTDWFLVRTKKGIEGWAARRSLEKTLTSAGVPATFRDTLLDDYLHRHLEVGFSFGSLDLADPMVSVRVGYRFNPNLALELAYAQSAGDFSSSTFAYLNLVSQPFPDWRVSPFFSLGLGRFRNTPKQTLIGVEETEANLGNVGVGVNVYATSQFIVRAEYRRHLAYIDVDRINEYNELSLGFSYFFF
jgi:hypothetical protein